MQNGLQIPPLLGIGEYQSSKRAPVEFTIVAHHARTKSLDDFCKCWLARFDHNSSRDICVDDGNTQFHESFGNRALPACNTAGESDAQSILHTLLMLETGQAQIAAHQRVTVHHGEPAGGGEVRPKGHRSASIAAAQCDHQYPDDRAGGGGQ